MIKIGSFCLYFFRLQRSESERTQCDQSDEAMRFELEGKAETLQKQLSDLDTLR